MSTQYAGPAQSVLSSVNRAAIVLALAVVSLLWGAGASSIALSSGSGLTESVGESGQVIWASSYSERFPGCVSLVLWPEDEQPVALLARTAEGSLARVRAQSGAAAFVPSGYRAIGACR